MGSSVALRILCSVWFLVVAAAVSPVWASQEPETVVRYVPRWDIQQSGVDDDLKDVMLLNDQLGWAACANNTILPNHQWRPDLGARGRASGARPEFIEVTFVSPTEGWVLATTTPLFTSNEGYPEQ